MRVRFVCDKCEKHIAEGMDRLKVTKTVKKSDEKNPKYYKYTSEHVGDICLKCWDEVLGK